MLELWYFIWVFLVIKPLRGYHYFGLVTLTLEFDPFFENFNLAINFWTVSARALILYMSISCRKFFLLLSIYLSMWPRPSLELAIIGGKCVSQTHLVLFSNKKDYLWISHKFLIIINENVLYKKDNNIKIKWTALYYFDLKKISLFFYSLIICIHLTDRSLQESLGFCLNKVRVLYICFVCMYFIFCSH